jgi:hypothetical protein
MWKKLVKCAIGGTVVLIAWGILSWMVLPMEMMRFGHEKKVAEAVLDNAPKSGLYVLSLHNPEDLDHASMQKEMKGGALMFAAIDLDASSRMSHIGSIIFKFLGALIVAWILMQSKMKFKKQVTLVTVLGLLIGIMGFAPCWAWFGFPGTVVFISILGSTIQWFLAGLVMAKINS